MDDNEAGAVGLETLSTYLFRFLLLRRAVVVQLVLEPSFHQLPFLEASFPILQRFQVPLL
jgi:hypothetical protein